MVSRSLTEVLDARTRGFPALLVLGPRQSGKTTWVRGTFANLPYCNLEDPIERQFAIRDPVAFLSRFPDGGVFDEAQHVPEIFSHLQVRIDAEPYRGLRWVLTGSQQFELRLKAQSMAGRLARFELLPFSFTELKGTSRTPSSLAEAVLRGGYPALYDETRSVNQVDWLAAYAQGVIDRDLRQVVNVRNPGQFYRFVALCAANSGQLLNKHSLAQEVRIDDSTATKWLDALEACYIVRMIAPHFRNFRKRITKSPKLYFLDSGLACRLLHISDVNQLRADPKFGALVETWCFGEILKSRLNRGLQPNLWTWRSSDGLEVDFLIEVDGGDLFPIEIKANQTPISDHARLIRKLRELSESAKVEGDVPGQVRPGIVIYGGSETYPAGVDRLVPWNQVDDTLRQLA